MQTSRRNRVNLSRPHIALKYIRRLYKRIYYTEIESLSLIYASMADRLRNVAVSSMPKGAMRSLLYYRLWRRLEIVFI